MRRYSPRLYKKSVLAGFPLKPRKLPEVKKHGCHKHRESAKATIICNDTDHLSYLPKFALALATMTSQKCIYVRNCCLPRYRCKSCWVVTAFGDLRDTVGQSRPHDLSLKNMVRLITLFSSYMARYCTLCTVQTDQQGRRHACFVLVRSILS